MVVAGLLEANTAFNRTSVELKRRGILPGMLAKAIELLIEPVWN